MAAEGGLVTIYALCEPDTLRPRYVGKANNLAARLRCHRWEARRGRLHTHKANWLRSLKDRDPEVVVLMEVSQDHWQQAERSWITALKRCGCDLTNFADGGQTSPVEGKGHTDATKAKLKAVALRRGCRPPSRSGQTASEETRAKLRTAAAKRGALPPRIGGWNKGVKKNHCSSGHKYTGENTKICSRRGRSYQICRTCERRNMRAYQARKKGV